LSEQSYQPDFSSQADVALSSDSQDPSGHVSVFAPHNSVMPPPGEKLEIQTRPLPSIDAATGSRDQKSVV
jgi:hypothetical protein